MPELSGPKLVVTWIGLVVGSWAVAYLVLKGAIAVLIAIDRWVFG